MAEIIMPANYVSVWDGSDEVRTNCLAKIQPNGDVTISDVESADEPEDAETLTEEYVELGDADSTVVKTFVNADTDVKVFEGQAQDSQPLSQADIEEIKALNQQHGWTKGKNLQ